ncbi:hypothetical protein EU805_03335 [Salipiger sp. IMCC34102]|uniref:hypothetical protein n=1 Tax=Salipiger sp. IMCC34102 TaxID=2510647 RepID=UPI00101DD9A2|nr:hypothetical protein [Salipiger sp. IMCC34102]RYH04417.1 hypothetical protein EU805_03335 [Salipiger sp. IMCC34102]
MPYADGRPREVPATQEVHDLDDVTKSILEALDHIDDPDYVMPDHLVMAISPNELLNENGERRSLPVRPEGWTPGPGEEHITAWRIEKEQPKLSRYDRAFLKKTTLQTKFDEEADLQKKQLIGLQLSKAIEVWKTELKRGTDDIWRARDRIDEWRSGAGRSERNSSRRKVRAKPNIMTPKAVLSSETVEQRHERERLADTARKRLARASLTEGQKLAVRQKDRDRKALKAAEGKARRLSSAAEGNAGQPSELPK